MAVTRHEGSSVLKLEVLTGTNPNGSGIHSTRTISDINPELADADLYDLGKKIADLQVHPLECIKRSDTTELIEKA